MTAATASEHCTMAVWSYVEELLLNRWLWAAALAVAAFRFWLKSTFGMCTSTRRLDGRTVLITGADTGIGLETARDLARRGARVLLAGWDPQRGQRALELVRADATRGATVELLYLDLASLASVRECAAQVLASESRLDVLINNADVHGLRTIKTDDSLLLDYQVNHFGPFLFTLLLLDLLKKSAPSRIIFVYSESHGHTELTPELLDYERGKDLSFLRVYAISKMANVLVSNEMARRLRGTGVTVNCVYPGSVENDAFDNAHWGLVIVIRFIFGLFFKSAAEGAQTTIHVAVSDEVEGVTGRYFADCKEERMPKAACDEALAKAVWEKSMHLVGLRDNEQPCSLQ